MVRDGPFSVRRVVIEALCALREYCSECNVELLQRTDMWKKIFVVVLGVLTLKHFRDRRRRRRGVAY
ncbi:uncharacterized protein ACA1_228680 [Acanthamoeba castellanii str. Neff]|uniref:Uncharacterized protein n=1 Tax=Acanthamoeba castellanii (strain ATCC 30010 / Neff) TaxID=1257118 RepID=L8H8S0_ACACF|nr:uncharacterized protein ACA1_228680 [Acanthamoeba castellanii str. Neff]ELR21597.1 hypothetical protein ACA1_228680 [Acanthamoeba castellanii str. Neff]